MGARRLVSTKRIHGTILDWHDKFGWIQAAQPIDHPDAARTEGKIFLAAQDVQEGPPVIGAAVTFFMYLDENGLGAMNVRQSTKEAVQAVDGMPVSVTEVPAEAKGSGGGKSGKYGKGRGGAPKGGASFSGGYRSAQNQGPAQDRDVVLERAHNAMSNSVWKATQKVARMEKEWDHKEFAKRITKYIYKAASAPELMNLPWDQAAPQFVESAMSGYSAACGDRQWFFDLDLAPTFSAAFWEIFTGTGQRAPWPEVEAALNGKYEELMDACLLEKAIWDSAGLLIKEEPLRNKLYRALKNSHETAYKEAINDPRPMADLERVEIFCRAWIETSMGKAWSALETAGDLMTLDNLVWLFQDLVAPFGEEHPFSCVPAALTLSIGRPPRDWPFLTSAIGQFLADWHGQSSKGAARGMKRSFNAFNGGKGGGKAFGAAKGGGKGKAGAAKRPRDEFSDMAMDASDFDGNYGSGEDEEDPVAQALLDQVAAAEARFSAMDR
eukprot:TRINITY_DN72254_c0_g1_i1.p1 TRINITY_DN72254_c0_g1~~TRINITY_DN72254_c0_g1_i1.p1  ORF type:complete len:495 (-),score=102.59 TRINITY_DN72254_c0_g1_i1:75-1559(-)